MKPVDHALSTQVAAGLCCGVARGPLWCPKGGATEARHRGFKGRQLAQCTGESRLPAFLQPLAESGEELAAERGSCLLPHIINGVNRLIGDIPANPRLDL
jgi:hypothetical protein